MSQKRAKRARQHRRAELGQDSAFVVSWMRKQLDKLRIEFARRLKAQRQQFPNMALPCDTCAFRSSADFTDGEHGFIRTTAGVVTALATDQIFYCHAEEKAEDGNYKPRLDEETGLNVPCAGWFVLQSTTPEPLNVRQVLGDDAVRLMLGSHDIIRRLDNEA